MIPPQALRYPSPTSIPGGPSRQRSPESPFFNSPSRQISFSYTVSSKDSVSASTNLPSFIRSLNQQPTIISHKNIISPDLVHKTILASQGHTIVPFSSTPAVNWQQQYDQLKIKYEQLMSALHRQQIISSEILAPLTPLASATHIRHPSANMILKSPLQQPSLSIQNQGMLSQRIKIQQIQERYNELRTKYLSLETEHSKCGAIIEDLQEQKSDLRVELSRLQQQQSPVRELSAEIIVPRTTPFSQQRKQQQNTPKSVVREENNIQSGPAIEPQIQYQIAIIDEAGHDQSKIQEVRSSFENREKNMKEYYEELLRELNLEIDSLKSKNQNLENLLISSHEVPENRQQPELKNRIRILEIEIERCNSTILKKNSEILQYKNLVEQSNKGETVQLRRLLAYKDDMIAALNLRLSEVEHKSLMYANEISMLKGNLHNDQAVINMHTQISELQRQLSYTRSQKEMLEQSLRKQLQEVRSTATELRRQNRQLQSNLEEAQERLREIQRRNVNNLQTPQVITQLRMENERLRQQNTIMKTTFIDSQNQLGLKLERIAVLELQIKELIQKQNIIQSKDKRESGPKTQVYERTHQKPECLERKCRQLEQELNRVKSQLYNQRNDYTGYKKSSDERLRQLENSRIDLEGCITQLKLELEHKSNDLRNLSKDLQTTHYDQTTNKNSNVELLSQLADVRSQLNRKTSQLAEKRVEYESGLRKCRIQFEDSHRSIVRIYEDKIKDLEKQKKRKQKKRAESLTELNYIQQPALQGNEAIRGLKRENHSLRKLVNQYGQKAEEYEQAYNSMRELQERIVEFEGRVGSLLDSKNIGLEAEKNWITEALRQTISQLNSKMLTFREENETLRQKVKKLKNLEQKLEKYSHENRRLVSGLGEHEQKVERLIAEVNRLRQLTEHYEAYISQQQSIIHQTSVSAAPISQEHFVIRNEEKIKLLEEKVEFFKTKNNELESRVNQLLALNLQLKTQLQITVQSASIATTTSTAQIILKQKLQDAQKNIQSLQRQLNQTQYQNQDLRKRIQSRVKQENQNRLQSNLHQGTEIRELRLRAEEFQNHNSQIQDEHRQVLAKLKAAQAEIQQLRTSNQYQSSQIQELKTHKSKESSLTNSKQQERLQWKEQKADLLERVRELEERNRTLAGYSMEQASPIHNIYRREDPSRIENLEYSLMEERKKVQQLETLLAQTTHKAQAYEEKWSQGAEELEELRAEYQKLGREIEKIQQAGSSGFKSHGSNTSEVNEELVSKLESQIRHLRQLVDQQQSVLSACEYIWNVVEDYQYLMEQVRENFDEIESLVIEVGNRIDNDDQHILLRKTLDSLARTREIFGALERARAQLHYRRSQMGSGYRYEEEEVHIRVIDAPQ